MSVNFTELPRSPFEKSNRGFVYLLRLGDKYKIGAATNLRTRVKSLRYELLRRGKEEIEVEHYWK